MKKFLSVILALFIALSCCIFAVAEDSAPDIEAGRSDREKQLPALGE